MADTEWLLSQIESAGKSGNLYEARSWLLTAKSMFPTQFSFHFQAYKLEYNEKNSKESAKIISDIFRQFQNEKEIWDEFEAMVTAICYNNNNVKEEIFGHLQPALQQQIMTMCLGKEEDVSEHCNLMIVLMKRFPETIMRFGVSMTEKLVEEEKTSGSGTPLNKYRRLLVCEILPVLCSSNSIDVSHKHFYKWLQKATEFYATYFTKQSSMKPDFKPIENSWEQCQVLLESIAHHCGWEDLPENSRSLKERVCHISDMNRRSRIDVLGKVNKKQIFYTTILLLMEGAAKYIKQMLPTIFDDESDSGGQNVTGYAIIDDLLSDTDTFGAKVTKIDQGISTGLASEYFHTARESWTILHSNDSFEKDFSHLYRRWKMDRWIWLQLFLVDYYLFHGNHKTVLSKLENIMQQDISKYPKCVLLRCSIIMTSAYYITKQLQMSCQAIMDSLDQLPKSSDKATTSIISNNVTRVSAIGEFPLNTASVFSKNKLDLVRIDFKCLLPSWIEIFLQSFSSVMEIECNDTVLGHSLVLLQFDWPRREDDAVKLMEMIANKEEFSYPQFFDYIINIDILEEFSFIRNQDKCKLSLLPPVPTLHQRVTRGVNKEASEDFNRAINRQILQSRNDVTNLIRQFLTEQHHSILNLLNLDELDHVKPMDTS